MVIALNRFATPLIQSAVAAQLNKVTIAAGLEALGKFITGNAIKDRSARPIHATLLIYIVRIKLRNDHTCIGDFEHLIEPCDAGFVTI